MYTDNEISTRWAACRKAVKRGVHSHQSRRNSFHLLLEVVIMKVKVNPVRTSKLNKSVRSQRLRRSRIFTRLADIALLLILVICLTLLAACSPKTAQGKIIGAFQSLSGMVQMYIEVELDDGTQVDAVLPIDQAIWDKAIQSVQRNQQLRVEVQQQPGEEWWEFVRFLEE